jgi:hypothetical protein
VAFTLEDEPETNVVQHPAVERPKDDRAERAASAAIMLALKSLSQRAVASAKVWFTLGSLASAWWLWQAIPDPSPTQIVSLSIYAVFVLAANIIVRRW